MIIRTDEPIAVAAVEAIHAGDVAALKSLLSQHPELATAALGDEDEHGMTRTLLHVVTDWPGHFPNGTETVQDARRCRSRRECQVHRATHGDAAALGREQ